MRNRLAWLRTIWGRNDRKTAWMVEQAALATAATRPTVDPRFRSTMKRAGRERSVILGHAVREPSLEVRLTRKDLLTHAIILGASDSGKTRLVSRIVMFVLREIARAPGALGCAILDFKSEFAALVSELTADLVKTLPDAEARAILDRWVVFNPFSDTSLVPMQILLRDPSVAPEIQAAELTAVVERMGGAALGVKQDSFTYNLLLLGVLEGLNILDLRRLLADLPTLEARARQSASLEVRETLGGTGMVQKASLEGVRARFDRLLRPPSMRLMLGAKSCISFRDVLGSKILLADVGSPPLGSSELTAFWAGFLMMRLTRSVFERTRADAQRPVIVFADEWQVGLGAGPDVADEFERVLAMARSRGVHLWMVSQSMAGAAKVSASLPDVVATNTGLHFLGRASIKDARLMSHLLPVTGRAPRAAGNPWDTSPGSPFLTPNEELERLVKRVSNQESRTFYVWDRRRPYRAELIRTATIEPSDDGFTNPRIAERLRDGTVGVPIRALQEDAARVRGSTFEPVGAAALVGPTRRPG